MELLLASGTNLDSSRECSKIFNNQYLSNIVMKQNDVIEGKDFIASMKYVQVFPYFYSIDFKWLQVYNLEKMFNKVSNFEI